MNKKPIANQHHSVNIFPDQNPSLMHIRKTAYLSSALLAFTLSYTHPIHAEEFTGAELLQDPLDQQIGYVQVAVTMAVFVAAQINKPKSDCMADWFLQRPGGEQASTDEMLGVIAQFRDYHPAGTILAYLQKQCGRLN